jgi:hypothetical protein
MNMKTTRLKSYGAEASAVWALMLLALFLSQPASVKAQWTTPDANQNINSTNTGNVGVGTATPNYKLDVTNSVDKGQIRFGMSAGDSGGFMFSNAPSHAVFSGGASWNGGWIAKGLSASLLQFNTGQVMFFANTGLTTGNSFTPTERMRISSTGYVGIGTTNPTNKFHVVSGTDSATTLLFLDTGTGHGGTALAVSGTTNNESGFDMSIYRAGQYFSRFGVNIAGNVYLQPGGGNVGFGTASPNALLDLASTTQLSNRIRLSGQEYFQSGNTSTSGVDIRLGLNRTGERQIWFADSASAINATTAQMRMRFQGTYASLDSISTNGTTTLALVLNSTGGSVGIGTATPNALYKLDVSGSVNSSGGLCMAGDCKTAWSQVGGASQWTTGGSNIYFNTGSVGIGTATPSSALDVRAVSAAINTTSTTGTNRAYLATINTGGTVAMGSESSGGQSIFNTGTLPYAGVFGTTSARPVQLVTNQTARMTIDTSGNVGIGLTSPVYSLDVNGGISSFRARAATVSSSDSIATFENASGIQAIIRGNGNVGIGITSPTTKLHVVGDGKFTGNLTVDGNIAAKFQDVAEWVPSTQELFAGTVVVLDQDRTNHVVASSQSYDTRVAGVVSAQPGVILGERGAGKLMVATTGRVRVKVDAKRAPIKIGDLLVTSDGEGLAMKSVPIDFAGIPIHRPGTIIGKALEALENGTGEILVLLSLQ